MKNDKVLKLISQKCRGEIIWQWSLTPDNAGNRKSKNFKTSFFAVPTPTYGKKITDENHFPSNFRGRIKSSIYQQRQQPEDFNLDYLDDQNHGNDRENDFLFEKFLCRARKGKKKITRFVV
jgi:hypothetical protein